MNQKTFLNLICILFYYFLQICRFAVHIIKGLLKHHQRELKCHLQSFYSFVHNCRGSNEMHQWGKLSRSLKMGEGVFLGHSLIIIIIIIINELEGFFPKNLQFDPPYN